MGWVYYIVRLRGRSKIRGRVNIESPTCLSQTCPGQIMIDIVLSIREGYDDNAGLVINDDHVDNVADNVSGEPGWQWR